MKPYLEKIKTAAAAGINFLLPFVGAGRTIADIHFAFNRQRSTRIISAHSELPEILADLKDDKHSIVTHSAKPFAMRVVRQHLKLSQVFGAQNILGLEDYGWEMKHESGRGLREALDRLGEEPGRHVKFYEDTAANLVPARRDLGLTTVFIGNARDIPKDVAHYVDEVAPDICVSLRKDILKANL